MITELQIKSKTDKELANVIRLASEKNNVNIIDVLWSRNDNDLYILVSDSRDNSNYDMCEDIHDFLVGLKNEKLEDVATIYDIDIAEECPHVTSMDVSDCHAREWFND